MAGGGGASWSFPYLISGLYSGFKRMIQGSPLAKNFQLWSFRKRIEKECSLNVTQDQSRARDNTAATTSPSFQDKQLSIFVVVATPLRNRGFNIFFCHWSSIMLSHCLCREAQKLLSAQLCPRGTGILQWHLLWPKSTGTGDGGFTVRYYWVTKAAEATKKAITFNKRDRYRHQCGGAVLTGTSLKVRLQIIFIRSSIG